MEHKEGLFRLIKERKIAELCKKIFPGVPSAQNMTPMQEEIIKAIVYNDDKRLCINAMTRYGKTQCVALATAIYILYRRNKKIALIGPTRDQTEIIRNYLAELIVRCDFLAKLCDIDRGNDINRLQRESSRKRLTFKNGCEIRTLSAHGEAEGLMGFGADVVIKDESALIGKEANAKIMRMLGDDPENAILIELSNPWTKDNMYYEHYISGRFKTIHVGWEIALDEGRVTQTFVDEMKEELTPIEFCVLYESNFPDEGEDSLFRFDDINKAIDKNFDDGGVKVISCDPADKGLDRTVLMWGYEKDGKYKVKDIYSEPISDNMNIANRIINWVETKGANIINIDCIGIGVGVVSRVKEVLRGKNIQINACHFGEAPEQISTKLGQLPTSTKKRFVNKKAEQYFRLKELFIDEMVDIPDDRKLKKELMLMQWDKTLSEKIKIVDPEDKSPDFADALVYFCWKDRKETSWFMA